MNGNQVTEGKNSSDSPSQQLTTSHEAVRINAVEKTQLKTHEKELISFVYRAGFKPTEPK